MDADEIKRMEREMETLEERMNKTSGNEHDAYSKIYYKIEGMYTKAKDEIEERERAEREALEEKLKSQSELERRYRFNLAERLIVYGARAIGLFAPAIVGYALLTHYGVPHKGEDPMVRHVADAIFSIIGACPVALFTACIGDEIGMGISKMLRDTRLKIEKRNEQKKSR